jgi:hypothetical protein
MLQALPFYHPSHLQESFRIGDLTCVVPERLLVRVGEEAGRSDGHVGAPDGPPEQPPEGLHAIRVYVRVHGRPAWLRA